MQTLPQNIPTYVHERIPGAIIPVVFAEAVRAIAACRSINEGRYWSDKADALAAWAKIYKKDEAAIEARRLKAFAYRRMSQLAQDLAQQTKDPKKPGRPSPRAQLIDAGLSNAAVTRIRQVGAVPQKTFDELMNLPDPPHVGRIAFHGIGAKNKLASSEAWRKFSGGKYHHGNGHKFRQFCRAHSALELGREISIGEVAVARRFVAELRDWLDEFEDAFPKESTK